MSASSRPDPKIEHPDSAHAEDRLEPDGLPAEAVANELMRLLEAARSPDEFFRGLELLFADLPPELATETAHRLFARAMLADVLAETLHELRSLITALWGGLCGASSVVHRLYGGRPADAATAPDISELVQSLQDAKSAARQSVAVASRASNLDSGRVADLGACVARGARLVRSARGRRVPLELRTEALDGLRVDASEGQVLQVLLNLLRNASEALADQPDGRLEIGGWASPTMAFFSVTDNGPGFDAVTLDAMRGGNRVPSPKPAGGGLGLSICRALVTAWGGLLEIDTQAGEGATVVVGVPLAPETGDPETGDPETGDPETGDPETGDPETGDPETGDTKTGDPKAGDPSHSPPSATDPDESAA